MNARIKRALKLISAITMSSMLLLLMQISAPSSVARHERFARDVTHLRGFTMDTSSLKGKKDVPPEDMALKDVTEDLNQYRFNRYSLFNHESFPDENNTVIQTQMLTLTQPLSLVEVANATVFSQYRSLNLHNELRKTIAYVLSKHSCPEYEKNNTDFPLVSFICRAEQKQPALVNLFTTMYNNPDKLIAFNNTLHLWASLRPSGLKPVLYITPNIAQFENNTFYLIERACALGWDVAIAPNCNNENYPLMRSMFIAGYSIWDSVWYSYVNGDILFDQSLFDALLLVRQYRSKLKRYTMLVGRRHDVNVQHLDNVESVKRDFVPSQIHADYGIDYFLTPRYGFPWLQVPPIVAGRPEVDSYLVWMARNGENITDIDATDAILALHQGKKNDWKRTRSRSVDHNHHVIKEQETALNVTQPYVRLQGRTDCLTYALNHNRSPYTHLYKRKVLIRGRDDKRQITCKDKSHMCCIKSKQIVTKDPNFGE